MTIYAIADIHGYRAALEEALARIEEDAGAEDAPVVFLGDLVDRGPDSRGVIDLLVRGIAEGRPWIVVKGNHDRLFERFLDRGAEHDPRIMSGLGWLAPQLGGPATLASYGVESAGRPAAEVLAEAREAVPASHLLFLRARPLWHLAGNLLFVHAGIRPGVPLEDQTEDDLLWIRQPFLDHARPHPWLVVHGHTPVDYPRHYGNRVNLDAGAGFGRELVPAVFEEDGAFLLEPGGRARL